MKHYKEFQKKYIGSSDIASLTIRSGNNVDMLHFDEDGEYRAYIITEPAEIGEHYNLVFEGKHWIRIYDDDELTFHAKADVIKIYRAGEFGCIIQLLGNTKPKVEDIITKSMLSNKFNNVSGLRYNSELK